LRVACNAINATVSGSGKAALLKSRTGIGTETGTEIEIKVENGAMGAAAAAAQAKRNWARKLAKWRQTSHVVCSAPRIGSAANVPTLIGRAARPATCVMRPNSQTWRSAQVRKVAIG